VGLRVGSLRRPPIAHPRRVRGDDLGPGPGYCSEINFEFETTAWDPTNGTPAADRPFSDYPDPAKQCVRFSTFDGSVNNPQGWSFDYPGGDAGYEPYLQELHTALCARPESNNCTL
jgi:hypothetical protein